MQELLQALHRHAARAAIARVPQHVHEGPQRRALPLELLQLRPAQQPAHELPQRVHSHQRHVRIFVARRRHEVGCCDRPNVAPHEAHTVHVEQQHL